MRLRLLLFGFLFFTVVNVLSAKYPYYVQTKDGVIFFTDSSLTGFSGAVKLEVVSDNIIRIVATAGKEISERESLITVYKKEPGVTWQITPSKDKISLKTKALTAIVNRKTGAVSFYDAKGNKILDEKPIGGRSFKPAVFDGERFYSLTQTFQSN